MSIIQEVIFAQVDITPDQLTQILIYSGALLAGLVLLALIYRWARRRMFAADDQAGEVPFSLHEIRDMHQSGQISEDEYNKLRDKILNESQSF